MIAETLSEAPPRRMTEAEFEAWCDEDTRAEFVDGEVILMSPASAQHVRIGKFLSHLIDRYLEAHPGGETLGPEFQIRLRAGLRRVPDLLYVAPEHAARVKQTYLDGPPDAAWEVVSPDSVERDWRDKHREYEAAGVREYWVIDPAYRRVRLYRLTEGRFEPVAEQEDRLESEVIPGFWLRPSWLWQQPLPEILPCLRELGAL